MQTQREKQKDFRTLLQDELVRRCKNNPKYSLRAFAKYLGLEPSHLSKILARKRIPTEPLIGRIGKKLGLPESQITNFQAARTLRLDAPPSEWNALPLDSFQVISDWYHYAILELVQLPLYRKADARKLASVLSISQHEANDAIERLTRLILLEQDLTGAWIPTLNNTTLGSADTAPALKKLQRSILEKALAALDETPAELRDQTSITMAIDSRLLPEARALTKRYRRELSDLLQKSNRLDSVYHLGVSLYPVTRVDNLNKNSNGEDQ